MLNENGKGIYNNAIVKFNLKGYKSVFIVTNTWLTKQVILAMGTNYL